MVASTKKRAQKDAAQATSLPGRPVVKKSKKSAPVPEEVVQQGDEQTDAEAAVRHFNANFCFDMQVESVPIREEALQLTQPHNVYTATVVKPAVQKANRTDTDVLIKAARERRLKSATTAAVSDPTEFPEDDESDEEMEFKEYKTDATDPEILAKDQKDKLRFKQKRGVGFKGDAEEGFADVVSAADPSHSDSFMSLNLSRPLLRAVADLQWERPTPIQAACIPLALQGRDICACARTGSGKTGAFLLPALERLLYKPAGARGVTRVLVLSPTRELAVQIHNVAQQLVRYAPQLSVGLSAGGLDVAGQEAALRLGPDVVIATPGRLIDHVHNAPNFHLGNIEILVLDEADKLVDEFFLEQLKEVVRLCARTRQTLLFSATMTDDVRELVVMSLRRPVKLFLNSNTDVALRLTQEFVRVRADREEEREALLYALLMRSFRRNCLVFLPTRKLCHRMHIQLGLLGVNCGELHSDLSQTARLDALNRFLRHELDVLLATDLASRGLDIEDVATVVNYQLPTTLKQYVHRAGRTARAGRNGRVVSLVGEQERSILKEIVRRAPAPVRMRTVPLDVINRYRLRLADLQPELELIEEQERSEKAARAVEQQLNSVERRLNGDGADEAARKRNWYTTNDKRETKKRDAEHHKNKKMQQKFPRKKGNV